MTIAADLARVHPDRAAPGHPVHRLLTEARRAVVECRGHVAAAFADLRHLYRRPVAAALLLVWSFGVIGDAYTTTAMMSTGLFEEANPYAAFGMDVLGVEGWVAVATAVCAVLAVAATRRPRTLYAATFVAGCVVVMLVKAAVTVSNALLWAA